MGPSFPILHQVARTQSRTAIGPFRQRSFAGIAFASGVSASRAAASGAAAETGIDILTSGTT
jgi:hypothetical protein